MKLDLRDVVSLQNESTAIHTVNVNSATIEEKFENTLSRDGTLPNHMLAALDMNSNAIINLPPPASATQPVRLGDIAEFLRRANDLDALLPNSVDNTIAADMPAYTFKANLTGVNGDPVDAPMSSLRIHAADWGVVADGTSQTEKLQKALDEAPLYSTLVIPKNVVIGLQGVHNYCIRQTRPVNVIGEGSFNCIIPGSDVVNNADLWVIEPTTGFWTNFHFGNLVFIDLNDSGTRRGRDAIRVDTRNVNIEMVQAYFHDMYIAPAKTGHKLGYAFSHYNDPDVNPNGGMYDSTIERCFLYDGIWMEQTGDHNSIQRNWVFGDKDIVILQIQGAGNFGFLDNNCGFVGMMSIEAGTKPTIHRNTFEIKQPSTNTEDAILYITGGTERVDHAIITNNMFQVLGAGSTTIPIKLGDCSAYIDGNRITVAEAYPPIVAQNSTELTMGAGNRFSIGGGNAAARVLTSGTPIVRHVPFNEAKLTSDANYAISVNDSTLLVPTLSTTRTYTLPKASLCYPGQRITIIDLANAFSSNGVTLARSDSDVFQDGSTSYSLSTAGMHVEAIAIPSNNMWHVTKTVK